MSPGFLFFVLVCVCACVTKIVHSTTVVTKQMEKELYVSKDCRCFIQWREVYDSDSALTVQAAIVADILVNTPNFIVMYTSSMGRRTTLYRKLVNLFKGDKSSKITDDSIRLKNGSVFFYRQESENGRGVPGDLWIADNPSSVFMKNVLDNITGSVVVNLFFKTDKEVQEIVDARPVTYDIVRLN